MDAAVLDASGRAALACVQSLGRRLAVGAFEVADAPAFHSRRVAATGILPPYRREAEYRAAVAALVERHRPRVLVPVHDASVAAVLADRRELERQTSVALASTEAMETAIDKGATLAVAGQLGIATPAGVRLRPGDDVVAAATEIGLPAVVKPVRSWAPGSADRLTSSAAVDVPAVADTVARLWAAGVEAILQRWLPGRREAVWLVVADGRVRARFAQLVHRMYPPLGGSSVVRESIVVPHDLLEQSEALVHAIGLEGFSEVEFRRDEAGRPVLMEINPRLSASVELALRAGLDVPALVYAWAAGLPLPRMRPYRVGLRMRWLGGDLRWLRATLRGTPGPDILPRRRALRAFAAEFARSDAYDYLEPGDLRPALAASLDFVRRGARTVKQADEPAPVRERRTA